MTHRDRLRRALRYETVDRLPTQIGYTYAAGEQLAAHLRVSPADLPARLDNHLVRVDLSCPKRLSADGSISYDWWGAGFATGEEGYFIKHSPLAGATRSDLAAFTWPDPHTPGLLDDAARTIAADAGEHFVVPNFGFSLFERAWSLRGFDAFLTDLALDPALAEELLDRIAEIQLVLIHRYLALGVDGGYFGDDYGAQKNLLFSPKTWRGLIKPRLARLFAPFRAAGLPVILHSDGNIAAILPDLVEIGLTVYNPVQPEVVDLAWLRRQFGRDLAYYGGISTQTVLPHGSPADVREAILTAARTLAPDGTGLLLAPSHRMMADIPMANVEAMLDTFAAIGAAPEVQA
jgi:uroporphyrinogen decarboxylase